MEAKDLKQELQEFIRANGISMNAVARGIGRSPATISQWLGGTYPGKVGDIDKMVRKYLALQAERNVRKSKFRIKPEFINTVTSQKIHEAIRLCHIKNKIGVITGNWGLGKTTAAREYSRQNSGVVYLEIDETFTAKALLQALHRELNLAGTGCIHELFRKVEEKVKDSGRLIIIDQAELLPARALDLLRSVHDKAHIGVILIGHPRLIENLRGKRGENVYLFSRVAVHQALGETCPEEAEMIVKSVIPDSNGLWKDFYKHARSFEYGQAGGRPNARILVNLIERAIDLADINQVEITSELVAHAADTLVR